MFCNNCGSENRDDAKFCSNCHAPINPQSYPNNSPATPENFRKKQNIIFGNMADIPCKKAAKTSSGKIALVAAAIVALAAAIVCVAVFTLMGEKSDSGNQTVTEQTTADQTESSLIEILDGNETQNEHKTVAQNEKTTQSVQATAGDADSHYTKPESDTKNSFQFPEISLPFVSEPEDTTVSKPDETTAVPLPSETQQATEPATQPQTVTESATAELESADAEIQ